MPMTQVRALLSALGSMAKEREALRAREGHLADRERKLVVDMGRALSDVGYRLERVDAEIQVASPTRRTRRRRKRQNLKCPKCERRFFFQMQVDRHMNAMHRNQRDTQKVKAA
jgi:uncharacterized C2H2 Zn-finger protein